MVAAILLLPSHIYIDWTRKTLPLPSYLYANMSTTKASYFTPVPRIRITRLVYMTDRIFVSCELESLEGGERGLFQRGT